MKLSHLDHMRAVEAVLRLGTFRAAALEIGITPAALGQRIRTLEDYIGQPLFTRRPDRAVPTEVARAVAEDLSTGFAALTTAHAGLCGSAAPDRLSLSMTQALAENWLPLHLPEFYACVDEVDLRIETSRALADLHGGAYDFAIRFVGNPGPGLTGVPLFRGSLVPLCTTDFAERYGLNTETRALDGVPLIHLDDPTSDPAWINWPGWCERSGVAMPDTPRIQTYSMLTSGFRIANSGVGLALTGVLEARHALTDRILCMPFGRDSIHWLDFWYWLVWSESRRLPRLHRTFVDWITDRANEECQYWGLSRTG